MTLQTKTALEALESKSLSISMMKKEISDVVTKAFLFFIVTELVESFNVGKTMDAMQAAFTVNGIISDYFFLKPEELKYCFNEAKKGRYGMMYDRIDAAVIFGFIDKFLEERTQLCYQKNEEQNKQYNKGQIHPEIAKKIHSTIKKPEAVNLDLIEPKQRERTEAEIFIQGTLKDFDIAHAKKINGEQDMIRTIEYKGKQLTQEKYLQEKINEIEYNK